MHESIAKLTANINADDVHVLIVNVNRAIIQAVKYKDKDTIGLHNALLHNLDVRLLCILDVHKVAYNKHSLGVLRSHLQDRYCDAIDTERCLTDAKPTDVVGAAVKAAMVTLAIAAAITAVVWWLL